MRGIELRLLGPPQLFVGGKEAPLPKTAVFECLAMVICAGLEGISRADLVARMWADLPAIRGRANLRVTLTKLRAELKKFDISECFDLEGEVLRPCLPVTVDVYEIRDFPCTDVSQVAAWVQPVAQGWDSDHWVNESEEVARVLDESFERLCIRSEEDDCLELLRMAVRAHPSSIQLVTRLVWHLTERRLLGDVNQEIIRFEEAWTERFGHTSLPNIELLAKASVPPIAARSATKVRLLALAAISGIAIAIPTLLRLRSSSATNLAPAPVRLVREWKQRVDGMDYRIRQVEIANHGPEIESVRDFADGTIAVGDHDGRSHFLPNDQAYGFNKPNQDGSKSWLLDQGFGLRVFGSEDRGSLAVSRGSQSLVLRGTSALPMIKLVAIEGRSSLLVDLVCRHPYECHHQLSIWDGSEIQPIVLPGRKPQITVVSSMTPDGFVGRYSLGKTDGWRYTPFRYTWSTGRTEFFTNTFVREVFRDGRFLVRPEVTDVIDGDYSTHPDGRILLSKAPGSETTVVVAGGKKFASATTLGNYVLATSYHGFGFWDLSIFNQSGKKVIPFPSLTGRVRWVHRFTYRDAVALFDFNPKSQTSRCFVIEVLSPPLSR